MDFCLWAIPGFAWGDESFLMVASARKDTLNS